VVTLTPQLVGLVNEFDQGLCMDSELEVIGVCTLSFAVLVIASWGFLNAGADLNAVLETLIPSAVVCLCISFFVRLTSPPIRAWILLHLGASLFIWQDVIIYMANKQAHAFLGHSHLPWWGARWIYIFISVAMISYSMYVTIKESH
jgi:hypothetical protein